MNDNSDGLGFMFCLAVIIVVVVFINMYNLGLL